ncbi:MAG: putative Ig domain-containing protein [Terriglobia bacterium]
MQVLKSAVWKCSRLIGAIFLLLTAAATPAFVGAEEVQGPILTPKPGSTAKINGPKVYGARPGHFFIYRIPCTGLRPIRFSVKGLPPSLHLDETTGIISGTAPEKPGDFAMTLEASNKHGKSSRPFKLVVGDTLALTPPMGWNDWYSYYNRVTDKVIREAAEAMINSGMADFGYQYVDIDDCWMRKPDSSDPALGGAQRGPAGAILPNGRFPDMNGLTAYIHELGLKAGIYTGPGPLTCGRFTASLGHEQLDAQQFADWGFDFLKYDLCSYRRAFKLETVADDQKPYKLMGGILANLNRDIVFNLCQYGRARVWNWGAEVHGNLWRTTGDLGAERGDRLPGFYRIAFANAEHFAAAGPGHWNDPDYILIGYVGNAFHSDDPTKRTTLTPDEQYSYMSMWSLMASPLFYSGVITQLDAFTLNVLCNSEVIDIDQDVLGKQATIIRLTAGDFVLSKTLEDGSLAVGVFNLSDTSQELSVKWDELALKGRYRTHDVWRQQDLGTAEGELSSEVNPHGVAFIHLTHAD